MAKRIKPDEARRLVDDNGLLVCAYDDEAKCSEMRLTASTLTYPDFRDQADEIEKDRPIIFYCG